MKKKLKKSTKKFLRNKKLRSGLIKRKKQTQRIKRDREIKNERLRKRNFVDQEKLEHDREKYHLTLSTQRSDYDSKDFVYDPKEELLQILSIQNESSLPPIWPEISPPPISEGVPLKIFEIPPFLKQLHDSSISLNIKNTKILPPLIEYYRKKFGRESCNTVLETFRVIPDQTKEFKQEKNNILLMFRVFVSLFRKNILFSTNNSHKEITTFFESFQRLLPFMGRLELKDTRLLHKILIRNITNILDEQPDDNKEEDKTQKNDVVCEIFRCCLIMSSFFPYPHIHDSLRYIYLLCLSFPECNSAQEMYVRVCSVELNITCEHLEETLKWIRSQLSNKQLGSIQCVTRSLSLIGDVLGTYRSKEFEKIIPQFFECLMNILHMKSIEKNFSSDYLRLLEKCVRVMELWGESQVCLHTPIVPYFVDVVRRLMLRKGIGGDEKEESMSNGMKIILNLMDRYIECIWNTISFEECSFLLVEELEKNSYSHISEIKALVTKIKKRSTRIRNRRENVSFDLFDQKNIEKFEWEMVNENQNSKKRKRSENIEFEDKVGRSKRRKLD